MKILLDTNIILDFALIREPFYDLADQIFNLIEQQKLAGYISATTFTDIYYILRKPRGKEWTLTFLSRLVKLCKIASVDDKTIKAALNEHYKDFEDDIQYHTAKLHQLDAIVTRNTKDYPTTSLAILSPEQLIERF